MSVASFANLTLLSSREELRGLGVDVPMAGASWYGEPPASSRERFMQQARQLGLKPGDSLSTIARCSAPMAARWRTAP